MIELEQLEKAFDLDKKRQRLARLGDVKSLKKLYGVDLPKVPDRNTPKEWDKFSEKTVVEENQLVQQRIAITKRLIPLKGSIIDIGVGYGYITKVLSREHGDFSYLGIDFSPKFISDLKRTVKDKRFSFKVTKDLRNITEKFDCILALEVLEHIQPSDIFEFLSSVKTHLNKGGSFIASSPVYENIKELAQLRGSKVYTPSGHVRTYNPELYLQELKMAGFEIDTYRFVYGPSFGIILKNVIKKFLLGKKYAYNIIVRAKA